MKKLLTISIIAITTVLASCVDDYFDNGQQADGRVNMTILLDLPGSNAQTRADNSDAEGIADESKITVVHLLVFQDGVLKEEVTNITSSGIGEGKGMLEAITENSYNSSMEVVLLTNVGKAKGYFNNSIGQTSQAIYQALTFEYSEGWDISTQPIPMWGTTTLHSPQRKNNIAISLYRALGKINVYNNATTNFALTSVRVYYSTKKGYSAPLTAPTAEGEITTPSVEGFGQWDAKNPLVCENSQGVAAFENQIYIPEADNQKAANGRKAVCLVVGGTYRGEGLTGAGETNYYRVDLKEKETKVPYDVLRNHLYRFTINSVSNPGTVTPEDALDNAVANIDVTVEAWNETYLRSLADQYSLTTDKSRVSFEKEGGTISVKVWSDYGEAWKIVDASGKEFTSKWFTHKIVGDDIVLTTTANYAASREQAFYIQVGQLKKQIVVEQAQPGTANSYIIDKSEDYKLSVVVKGNGTQGLYADDKDGIRVKLDETAVIAPHRLRIIWETKKGLVQLLDPVSNAVVTDATYNTITGELSYRVNTAGALIDGVPGGNALIGAFDEKNELIWSWHIWVCPDKVKDEKWTLTGYDVMDRNLGAVSSNPGVASLGLLYQWGRKDPFIGAGKIADTGVDKLYTENYSIQNYDATWGVGNERTIDYTIKNPTKLIHDGLVVTDKKGQYLWGTNGGLNTQGIKDLGTKTIYDPCPVGYRVPPVDAFVFKTKVTYDGAHGAPHHEDEKVSGGIKEDWSGWETCKFGMPYNDVYVRSKSDKDGDGTFYSKITKYGDAQDYEWRKIIEILTPYTVIKSSEKYNWNENLIYVPHALQNEGVKSFDIKDYLYSYNGTYQQNKAYYGFYLNFTEISEPKMENMMDLDLSSSRDNITWLPLSGAYDPLKTMSFNGVTVEKGSSLTVNSFLWTNSSVKKTNGSVEPAAMFLHGAENPNTVGGHSGESGRHIHGLTKSDINARPDYAGAVRCVRDTKKDFSADNKVPADITAASASGETIKSEVFAINDTWRVVDPGAPWIRITPDQANPDKGRGTKVTIIISKNETGREREATIKIKFSGENEPRSFKITQNAN